MLFALSGNNINESSGESNKPQDSREANFQEIFAKISNELESESKEAPDISELAEMLDSQALEQLRKKLKQLSLAETVNEGELPEQPEINNILELADMLDSQTLRQLDENLSKLSLAETDNEQQLLKKLKQVIPSEVLSRCESTDRLISKLDSLKSAIPGAEKKISKLKNLLNSHSEKVDEFLKGLKSPDLSKSKPAVKSTAAETGSAFDKTTSGKFSDGRSAVESAGVKPQNTSTESSREQTAYENITGISNKKPQADKNSQTGFSFQQKGENSFSNSGRNRLADMRTQSKAEGNSRNMENDLLSNKSGKSTLSRLGIKGMEKTVKSSKSEFDFSDIQATLRQASQSVKSQPEAAKRVDFTGRQVNISKQVQESIQTAAEKGMKQVKVNLNPPELGKIVINLKQRAGQLTGRLEVTNPQTKMEIDKAIAGVVENLKTAGLTIQKPEVVLTDNNSTNSYQQQFRQEFTDSQFTDQQGGKSDGDFGRGGDNRSGQNSETVLSSAGSAEGEVTGDNTSAAGSLDFLM